MTFDEQIENTIDDILENGYEPKAWMRDTDRVVDAYKREVEMLRSDMKALASRYSSIQEDISTLKLLHAQLTALLEEDK